MNYENYNYSLVFLFAIASMSFVPNHKIQNKSLKFKGKNGAMLTLDVAPSVGPGLYEYTVEVTGAATNAVSIDIPLDFNGEHTNTIVNITLTDGYGFLDASKSFEVVEVELNPSFSYDNPQYHY